MRIRMIRMKQDQDKNRAIAGMRSSGRWQKLRELAMNLCPICMVCGKRPAREAHHIDGASASPEKFFDLENIAPVCLECHGKVKNLKARNIDAEMIFPKDKRLKGN
jgi:HNH endonuclease